MSNNTLEVNIQWGAPPPKRGPGRRNGGRTFRFVQVLKQRPGQWAKYPWKVKGSGTGVLNAKRYAGTEWTTRSCGNGFFELYGRWIGENGEFADLDEG